MDYLEYPQVYIPDSANAPGIYTSGCSPVYIPILDMELMMMFIKDFLRDLEEIGRQLEMDGQVALYEAGFPR